MNDDRPILTANSHGDNILCNNLDYLYCINQKSKMKIQCMFSLEKSLYKYNQLSALQVASSQHLANYVS